MPIVPIYGHDTLRERLLRPDRTLPSSILLHGQRGIGKQRLALWLAQAILCEAVGTQKHPERHTEGVNDRHEQENKHGAHPTLACGVCSSCRMLQELRHPDVYWFYPKPRLKTPDPTPNEVLQDYAESTAERVEHHGLYPPPSGNEGLYIATVRTIVQRASLAPALAKRKVFIVGDAERMISQEGADQAANAFLKLLEEPPADTTIVLTSSEPGALLPTIRSRVVAFRCAPLSDSDVHEFLNDPIVTAALDASELPQSMDERVTLAAGAPGQLIGASASLASLSAARELLRAADRRGEEGMHADAYMTAMSQGVSQARGAFADTLKALNTVLRTEARDALQRGDSWTAFRASRRINAVARAQGYAEGNVNPQLIAARLIRELARA